MMWESNWKVAVVHDRDGVVLDVDAHWPVGRESKVALVRSTNPAVAVQDYSTSQEVYKRLGLVFSLKDHVSLYATGTAVDGTEGATLLDYLRGLPLTVEGTPSAIQHILLNWCGCGAEERVEVRETAVTWETGTKRFVPCRELAETLQVLINGK